MDIEITISDEEVPLYRYDGTEEECERFLENYKEEIRGYGVAMPSDRFIRSLYFERCGDAA